MSDAAARPILELNNIRKVFRGDILQKPQVALSGLTCTLKSGSCTALLGHNGAGKTTAIRLILGLLRPDSGSVLFAGRPLTTAAKRHLGYMPETNKLPSSLTVSEVLHHQLLLFAPDAALSRAGRKQHVEAMLVQVGLTKHAKKLVGKLSKGLARRLAWAQATIHKPQLLILDEPASGLDPLGRRRLLEWMTLEKERGATLLLCTHELAQVTALCDEYLVLRSGQLVASGKVAGGAGAGYALHVSGIDERGLQRLADSEGLPPWRAVRQAGFLAELSFADYEGGAAWLTTLLRQNYVVTSFGDDVRAFVEQLLTHFHEES